MRKIKYQGGLTKLLTSKIGQANKEKFGSLIDNKIHQILEKFETKKIDLDVASFSSKRDFYDQVFSIISFLRFVGEPLQWYLHSDGSHTQEQIAFMKVHFPFIVFSNHDFANSEEMKQIMKPSIVDFTSPMLHFANASPYGKKLFYYLNLEVKNPTFFLDSDILFYRKSTVFEAILSEHTNGWYLPDQLWGCLDTKYKDNHKKQPYQVNSGLFLLNKELDNLKPGLDYLNSLNCVYENFTEQTVFHILFRENNLWPFDPRIFILDSGDQFDISYIKDKKEIAARHYTGPVRHKMWQRNWKWHLEID